MANYRNISISFWTDSKVDDEFTPEDKYFYLYLLTNPHTNICGCYEISMKQMERETGYNADTVKRLLGRMEHQHKVIMYAEETKEILILNWCKYNWTDSAKLKNAIASVAQHIKSRHFQKYVADTLSIGYPYRIDTLSIPYTYPMDTSVSDTDTDTGTDTGTDTVSESDTESVTVSETETENRYSDRDRADKPRTRARFTAPTLVEVKAYCDERKNGVNPQRFIDYYSSNGWKVGRNPMKDWKAAVRTWEKNGYDSGKKQTDPQVTNSSIVPGKWEQIADEFDPWAELEEMNGRNDSP